MAITGDATIQFKVKTPPAPPAAEVAYEAMVLRVRSGDESADRRLERHLNDLGAVGWYPSGSVGDDLLILSRLVATQPGPATKVTVTWGEPQPIPKGN